VKIFTIFKHIKKISFSKKNFYSEKNNFLIMNYLNPLLEKIKFLNLEEKIDLKKVEKAYNFAKKAHE